MLQTVDQPGSGRRAQLTSLMATQIGQQSQPIQFKKFLKRSLSPQEHMKVTGQKVIGLSENYAEVQAQHRMAAHLRAQAQAHSALDARGPEEEHDPFALDAGVSIVPCRWSNSGWRYVATDPEKKQFFNNPNRVNSHGWPGGAPPKPVQRGGKVKAAQRRNSIQASCRTAMGQYGAQIAQLDQGQFQSSYQHFFSPSNQAQGEGWKTKFGNAEFSPKTSKKHNKQADQNERLINWGGGCHQRRDFNKRKDHIADWTETYFRP